MKINELVWRAGEKYRKFETSPVAFFCSEYALDDDASMYAGGLGVLAGDYLLTAAAQGLPVIALGLKYGAHDERTKHFCEHYQLLTTDDGPLTVTVPLGAETVKAQVWLRQFGENVTLLLLDSDIPENVSGQTRGVTRQLYDPDFYARLKQQILLGLGGIRLLRQLGIAPAVYHLNEGHTAFAALGLLAEAPEELPKVVATKHTIFSASGLLVTLKDFSELLGPYCRDHRLDPLAVFERGRFEQAPDTFSTTRFLMMMADRGNGVSALHAKVEKEVHPDSRLIPITNGVYAPRWQAATVAQADTLAELWQAKNKLRAALVDFVALATGAKLDPTICTLVWARRFAAYKRPLLLFSDLTRLGTLTNDATRPLQIVISGKAHEADDQGQEIIRHIKDFATSQELAGRIAYLPDYSLSSARFLAQGADLWLNTPERGKEACGTSGMKAGLNGALQASVSDGWVDEVDWQDRGWILPETDLKHRLYDILAEQILPKFYDRDHEGLPLAWLERMRRTIDLVAKDYLADRMLEDYVRKLYNLN